VIRYRGLTWDHPRGFNALAAAAARLDAADGGIAIAWEKQPLEDFESAPLEDLAARYDLIVLDHPHVGDAVASGCLVPLEKIFTPEDLAAWSRDTVGPCLASYRYAGRHWALPLDAATQVLALRPGIVEPPDTWDDVLACPARVRIALPLGGPHPILAFFSIAAALGAPPAEADPDVLLPHDVGLAALEILAEVYARMPGPARSLNPIGLLGAMAEGDAFDLCPLVYGYVNYTGTNARDGRGVAYSNAPRAGTARRGSTLGGTGIGITRRCRVTADLLDHLRWLLGTEAQIGFIPAHDGQPSRREAWTDGALNARYGNFYRHTIETIEHAYVRPRYAGYVAFQREASALLRTALLERHPHRTVLDSLQASYRRSRPAKAEV
jgi:multiple sugar transport system substrate-binding protein